MTRDRRLPVLSLLLLASLWLSVAEARHNHDETAVRHRHRHRHEPTAVRRTHHTVPERRNSWSTEVEYENDSADEPDDYDDQEDYQAQFHRDRNYPRSSRTNYHARTYETRYSAKYHRPAHRGWYDEDAERHRRPRYGARNHQPRSPRTRYNRPRDGYDYEDDAEEEEELEHGRSHRFQDNEGKHHAARQKTARKHRTSWRREWRNRQNSVTRGAKRIGHVDDSSEETSRNENARGSRAEDWRRRSNSSDSKYGSRNERRRDEEESDYYDDLDKLEERRKEEEEEEDIWKEAENEADDEDEENDEDLDNNYYRTGEKPPLKTYDDIIRRLTADDPTTPSTMLKRDYRNIEFEKYLKRDAYGNLLYEPRNSSKAQNSRDTFARVTSPSYMTLRSTGSRKEAEKLTIRPADRREKTTGNANFPKTTERQVKRIKAEESPAKTKSLEQDYEDYLNAGADEKEEDLIKAGVEDDSAMQADVTNTDYSEDENTEENETPANNLTTTTRRTTTAGTTTTTTTSTTTTRPAVTQHYDYRDPRAYESGTGSQYNGYQPKNEYPPMSAHSVHKWQSLGTRESVKETRSNMHKYNKNGRSAEIREALNHAIKVSREGSCQWPRARVIPVRDVYPSPSTTYMPHCAILHRCSDDTGCCRSEALTCVPKHSHRVELYFYTTNVSGSSVVEKLSFYNHTECECREKSEYLPANEKPSEQRFYRHYQPSTQPQNMRRGPVRKPCKCPSEFTPRITPDGQCQCNCFENDENCMRTRRGKGYFSLSDRLCIQNSECASPNCEFGEYMRLQGRCPRKRDKFDAIANYHTSLNHHRYRS